MFYGRPQIQLNVAASVFLSSITSAPPIPIQTVEYVATTRRVVERQTFVLIMPQPTQEALNSGLVLLTSTSVAKRVTLSLVLNQGILEEY